MNKLYITNAGFIFYYLEFPESCFFFPKMFYSNINYIERNINFLFVCVCSHPTSGVFGAAEKGCSNTFFYDNLYWNVSSWQQTEEQNID